MTTTKMTRAELNKKALDEHIAAVVAAWPPPEPWQVRRVVEILYGRTIRGSGLSSPPERPEVRALRNAEDELAKVRKSFKEEMAGCRGCGLSRDAHKYQGGYGLGYHAFDELTPDDAIKVAQSYKKKISTAEKALEKARAA